MGVSGGVRGPLMKSKRAFECVGGDSTSFGDTLSFQVVLLGWRKS